MKKRKKASSFSNKNENSRFARNLILVILALLVLFVILIVSFIYVQSSIIKEKGVLYSVGNFFSFKWLYGAQLGVNELDVYGHCSEDGDCSDLNTAYGCVVGYCEAGDCSTRPVANDSVTSCNDSENRAGVCTDGVCVCTKDSCNGRYGIIDDLCGGTIDCGAEPTPVVISSDSGGGGGSSNPTCNNWGPWVKV